MTFVRILTILGNDLGIVENPAEPSDTPKLVSGKVSSLKYSTFIPW
jgi:hypothetical protein